MLAVRRFVVAAPGAKRQVPGACHLFSSSSKGGGNDKPPKSSNVINYLEFDSTPPNERKDNKRKPQDGYTQRKGGAPPRQQNRSRTSSGFLASHYARTTRDTKNEEQSRRRADIATTQKETRKEEKSRISMLEQLRADGEGKPILPPRESKLPPRYEDILPDPNLPREEMMQQLSESLDEILPLWDKVWSSMSTKEILGSSAKRSKDRFLPGKLKKAEEEEDETLRQKKKPNEPIVYERKVNSLGYAFGRGGRKNSKAQVWLREGTGIFKVNKKDLYQYFGSIDNRFHALEALTVTNTIGTVDVHCYVRGGGTTGQSGAIRHGVARALQALNPELRAIMKPLKLLTRDSRVVERKKPGQKKARKKFQWVKR